jgi:hypothetical protein
MSTSRVKEADLHQLVKVLNNRTGSPLETFRKDADGRIKYNIGNYHLDMAYGCAKLVRACKGGGTKDISGFCTKRELKLFIEAYLLGVEANE